MKKEPDYEKMSLADQIREGLKDSIAHARGELSLKTTTLAAPAPSLSKSQVAAIRRKARMSQAVFASYLNVPKKTLQSWEQGARSPKAGEARLLQLVNAAPEQFVAILTEASNHQTSRKPGPRPRRAKAAS